MGQHREPKQVLKGWKLYIAAGVLSYVVLFALMWLSSMKRHTHPFETTPEIAVFAAIAAVCFVLSIARDKHKKR